MREGDLVLTPPMCWHGHINESGGRTVWFDAANMPAVCALDASFFEPGTRADERFWEVSNAGSQAYRFPGDEMRRRLDAAPVGADGARTVRYGNEGASVMATLDLFRLQLTGSTRPKRATHSAVCLVVDGDGRSTVGDKTFEWSRHDVFTIPHWTWASHEARTRTADLLLVTDRAIYERLELLREELQ
jgi:gentisate 1,2-dioxygenase